MWQHQTPEMSLPDPGFLHLVVDDDVEDVCLIGQVSEYGQGT
jgi:hypothetical protein